MSRFGLTGDPNKGEAVVGIGFQQLHTELCALRRSNVQLIEAVEELTKLIRLSIQKADEGIEESRRTRDEWQKVIRAAGSL